MKDQITIQSIALFGEKGYSETSVQDIVNALGVTKGTFYYYFRSKQELLMDIHLTFINQILEREKKILKDQEKDCKTKVAEIVRMLVQNIEKQRSAALIYFREQHNLDSEQVEAVLKRQNEFRSILQKLIETGMETKEFRSDLRPDMVTFGILGICNWSYFWFDPDGSVPDEELAVIYSEMILNGIDTK
ncbi:MAG TPA: TetR/AcrR family transcriptional regulator [Bacillales bacterium]|nr:TetR/AcrR family transcriptional regulator [Bacillales bacterium]